jgi:hypothetical protein
MRSLMRGSLMCFSFVRWDDHDQRHEKRLPAFTCAKSLGDPTGP